MEGFDDNPSFPGPDDADLLLETLIEASDDQKDQVSTQTCVNSFCETPNKAGCNEKGMGVNLSCLEKIDIAKTSPKRETFYKVEQSSESEQKEPPEYVVYEQKEHKFPQETKNLSYPELNCDRFTGVKIRERCSEQKRVDAAVINKKATEMTLKTYKSTGNKKDPKRIALYAVMYQIKKCGKTAEGTRRGNESTTEVTVCKLCDPHNFEINETVLTVNEVIRTDSDDKCTAFCNGMLILIIHPSVSTVKHESVRVSQGEKPKLRLLAERHNIIQIGVVVNFGMCAYIRPRSVSLRDIHGSSHDNSRCHIPVNISSGLYCPFHKNMAIQSGIAARAGTSGNTADFAVMERMLEVRSSKREPPGSLGSVARNWLPCPSIRRNTPVSPMTAADRAKERTFLAKRAKSGSDAAMRLLELEGTDLSGGSILNGREQQLLRQKKSRFILDRLRHDL